MKRVLLYRFDRPPTEAIVSPGSFLHADHAELLTSSGTVQIVPYPDLKAICFTSEHAEPDLFTIHTRFERRPKAQGLWARFTLRDGDQIEGVLPHNLLEWPEAGYMIVPPRSSGGRQRVFLARAALTNTELLGVVGVSAAPSPARKSRPAASVADQLKIFDQ